MAALLRKICREIEQSSYRRHISLDVDDDLLLLGSEVEIHSLCSNLLYNAVQHTTSDVAVTAYWRQLAGDAAQLSVIDEGAGIEPRHLNHITERFYRADTSGSRASGGTGLGLSIVKHIAARHGGELKISSSLANKTDFSVIFPPAQVTRNIEPLAAAGSV